MAILPIVLLRVLQLPEFLYGLVRIAASTILIAAGAALAPPTGTVFVVSGLAVLGIAGSVWNIRLTTLVTRDADSSVLGRVSVNLHTLTALAAMAGAMLRLI